VGRGKSFDEDEALVSALEVFWSSGYAGTSVDDLARAMGLGKGSLYGTFRSKSALFSRAFDAYCATVERLLAERLRGPDQTAMRRLCGALVAMADNREPSAAAHACFLARTTAELGGTEAAIADRARNAFASMIDTFTACVEQAQRAGDVDPGHDARRLAHLVLTIHRGIEAVGEAGVDPAILSDAIDLTMCALAAPPQMPRCTH
jgi:TetR/AcrR family transcriptional repressor of nem operon